MTFRFGAALSTLEDPHAALDEVATLASAPLSDTPHLAVAFATPHHAGIADDLAARLADLVGEQGTSIGAIADGVIGGSREVDDGPGLSLWVARLPGVDVVSSHLEAVRTPEGVAVGGWSQPVEPHGVILLADPFTFPAGSFASTLGERGLPVVGGLVNGGGPGKAVLVRNGEVHRRGAVSVAMGGEVDFRTVVSQGCRPIGAPAVVTRVEGTTIEEIGGRPALEYLQDMIDTLDRGDRRLVASGLQIGVAADEYRTEFERGDFLVRGVVDADPDAGTISIGEHVAVGQTVQFQVRDPDGADEDLRALLAGEPTGTGVLIFSCNGRGSRFFGRPDHDAAVVDEVLDPAAAAGFFAAGELGPVGGANHLHGFTASILELRPRPG
ncbi:MAG: FIST N-terminal domain-containing protein [Acidimicrobiia bacterium]|nr:FIST N-terminal domain-containing protein [Acidimicrobiia bacterium]